MAILNEAQMRIGDARGQLELERLRREREDRKYQMMAQGLTTITQGGLGALQTGAQFATDYQNRQAAEQQFKEKQALAAKIAQDKAARDAAKMKLETDKVDILRAQEASLGKLRDARIDGEQSLVVERRSEAAKRLMPHSASPEDIAKVSAGAIAGIDPDEAADASQAEIKSIIQSGVRGQQQTAPERTRLDAEVERIVAPYNQRADAYERSLLALDYTPEQAAEIVKAQGLRPDPAAVKQALLRERDTRTMSEQEARLKASQGQAGVREADLQNMAIEAYGVATDIVRAGREPTEEDVENLTIQLGVRDVDARTALARAMAEARKDLGKAAKTEAETADILGKPERQRAKLAATEVAQDASLANVKQMVKDLRPRLKKMAPAMGFIKSRVRRADSAISQGEIGDILKERGVTDISGTDFEVFRSDLAQFNQVYGKMLEGGRMTDSDREFYQRELSKDLNPKALKGILDEIEYKIGVIEKNNMLARTAGGRSDDVPVIDVTATLRAGMPTSFESDETGEEADYSAYGGFALE
jgi:hypothetical protein